jgi:hypothetical protein
VPQALFAQGFSRGAGNAPLDELMFSRERLDKLARLDTVQKSRLA